APRVRELRGLAGVEVLVDVVVHGLVVLARVVLVRTLQSLDELRVLRELLVHTLRAHLRLRSGEGRADDGDVAVLTHLLGIDLVVALRRGGVAVCSARTALPAGVAVRWSVAVTTVARPWLWVGRYGESGRVPGRARRPAGFSANAEAEIPLGLPLWCESWCEPASNQAATRVPRCSLREEGLHLTGCEGMVDHHECRTGHAGLVAGSQRHDAQVLRRQRQGTLIDGFPYSGDQVFTRQ